MTKYSDVGFLTYVKGEKVNSYSAKDTVITIGGVEIKGIDVETPILFKRENELSLTVTKDGELFRHVVIDINSGFTVTFFHHEDQTEYLDLTADITMYEANQ